MLSSLYTAGNNFYMLSVAIKIGNQMVQGFAESLQQKLSQTISTVVLK